MKNLCFFLASLAFFQTAAFGDTIEAGGELDDRDIRALKEWVDTKRQISLKEIGGDLSISGEVRTEFQNAWERVDGRSQRGTGTGEPQASGFDVEVNLLFDYRTDRTWAAVKLEFDNDAGVFSGTFNKLALERAYWGVRAVEGDALTFDIEVGRRKMLTVFDSRLQFASIFDGILFRYDQSFEKVGDFYLRAGPYVINELKNHFGYIGELGLLNIAGTGFYAKTSFVDWDTKDYKRELINQQFDFIISQINAGYRFKIQSIEKLGVIYSAFLWNWAAKRRDITGGARANWAAYVGMSIGQLRKQWDWAFDFNYQWMAPQSVPNFDISGVSIGNAEREGFYTVQSNEISKSVELTPQTQKTARGGTNFHGFMAVFDVLLTNKLDLQQSWIQSWTLYDSIGPSRCFSQYEIEFIYTW